MSVSHLRCLAQEFLKENPSQSDLIPRGGSCRSCSAYVLWGDIIRGCYRRQKGGVVLESEVDAEEDELSGSEMDEDPQPPQGRKRGRKPKSLTVPGPAEESEHECFDLDAISSCEESDVATQAPPPSPSKPRSRISKKGTKKPSPSSKESVAGPSQPVKRGILCTYFLARSESDMSIAAPKRTRKAVSQFHTQATQGSSSSGEFFDLNDISSDDEPDNAHVVPPRLQTVTRLPSRSKVCPKCSVDPTGADVNRRAKP